MNKKALNEQKIKELGLSVLQIEAQAILDLCPQINEAFVSACKAILNCTGRVIVSGMGKSGHIGKKIAATLTSTGTPAFFLHPAEASHGDLGLITHDDLLILLSYSGETKEITNILPAIKQKKVFVIAITGSKTSTVKEYADIYLYVPIQQEACSLGLAPTASTTAMLAMGDALAVAVLDSRGFTIKDFAQSHPGGHLGQRLACNYSSKQAPDDSSITESEKYS